MEEQGIGGDRAGTRWVESPPGARAGREGCSHRILPHHSFLTSPRIHLRLLLHKHHWSCVGTAWGTRRGLALGPSHPALRGRGVMEGRSGDLRQTVPPYPYSWLSVSARFASAPACRGVAFPDVQRIEQVGLVLACEILRGIGPVLVRFCHMALLPISSTAEPAMLEVSPSVKGWLP